MNTGTRPSPVSRTGRLVSNMSDAGTKSTGLVPKAVPIPE